MSPRQYTTEQYQRWHVRICARCSRKAAKAANFSDGPICRTCLDKATRNYGVCAQCQSERLLPGRDHTGTAICRDCAGITRSFTCARCQVEGSLVAGLCERCRIVEQLTEVLDDGAGRIHPPLLPLFDHLTTMARPRARLDWIKEQQPRELLADLATGRTGLTSEAFEQLPNTKTVTYVSDLLIECGILSPTDRQLSIYQRWLTEQLADVANPSHAQLLHRFTAWHQLRTLRAKTSKRPLSSPITGRARSEVRAAGAFLVWLAARNIPLIQCRQIDLDAWCVANPDTDQPEKAFLIWLMTTRRMPRLAMPPKSRPISTTTPMSQRARIAALHQLLTDQTIPLRTRVAGSILLLYAQPTTRIVRLTIDDVVRDCDQVTLRLGDPPVPVPEPFAGLLMTYIQERPNLATANGPDSRWLFPGRRAGQPMHIDTLGKLIRKAGVPVRRGRESAIRQLVLQMPPPVVAQAFGYHQVSVTRIASQNGSPWSGYAAGDHTHSHNPEAERA